MSVFSFNRIRKVLFVFFIAVFLLAAFLLLSRWDSFQGRFEPMEQVEKTLEFGGLEYVRKDDIETYLVLGLDEFEGDSESDSITNDKQADLIMLFVFDNKSESCSIVHINRDTMTEVNVLGVGGHKIMSAVKQISLSHVYGNGREQSCRNVADAVSELLLDIKVDHFVSMPIDAFSVFNDMIGGVQVEITDDFASYNDSWTLGSKVILFGEDVLAYIGECDYLEENSNILRMKRQIQYINAAYEKIQAQSSYIEEFSKEILELAQYIVSDRSAIQLTAFVDKLKTYSFNGIFTVEGESEVGIQYPEFYADENSVLQTVVSLFYEANK